MTSSVSFANFSTCVRDAFFWLRCADRICRPSSITSSSSPSQAGLSQEELADRAKLDRTYISGVERGVRNPTVLVLQRLATALNIRPADLLAYGD